MLFARVAANKRKSALLLAVFIVLLGGVGVAVDLLVGYGTVGIVIILVVVGIWTGISWYRSDRIALAVARARKIDHDSAPQLFNVVDGLCIAAG